MAKEKKDGVLDKLTPDDIENIILPTLKKDREKILEQKAKIKKKKNLKTKILALSLLFIFMGIGVFSGVKVLAWKVDSDKTYSQIEMIEENVIIEEVEDTIETEIVNPPKEKNTENPYWDYIKMKLINVDFTNLLSINSDTKGWISVNGTNINYPFVQTVDNEYYLKRDFNKKSNSAGWVYLDYRNNITELDRNTILYAHGRLNGTMFGSLKNIFNSDWYNDVNNHVIKLSTLTENTLWQVFSVYHIPTTSDYLQTEFGSSEEFLTFIQMLKDRSQYGFNVEFNENDKILTLSTCYNDQERVVLHAKLIKREARQ